MFKHHGDLKKSSDAQICGGGSGGTTENEVAANSHALTREQERFYESLFLDDSHPDFDKDFHPRLQSSLYEVLTSTYGLPAAIKSRARKANLKLLLNLEIIPYADIKREEKKDRASKLKLKDKKKIDRFLLDMSDDFFAEIQRRLELALNANLTEEDQVYDEAQCLALLKYSVESEKEISNGCLFVSKNFLYAAQPLLAAWNDFKLTAPGAPCSDHHSYLSTCIQIDQLASKVRTALEDEIFSCDKAEISTYYHPGSAQERAVNIVVEVAQREGLLTENLALFKEMLISKLTAFAQAFSEEISEASLADLMEKFPDFSEMDPIINSHSHIFNRINRSLSKPVTSFMKELFTAADVMCEVPPPPPPSAKKKKKKKKPEKPKDEQLPARSGTSAVALPEVPERISISLTTDTVASVSAEIAAPEAEAADAPKPHKTEKPARHYRPTGQKLMILNPKRLKLNVVNERIIVEHRHIEFNHPVEAHKTLVYDSDPDTMRSDVLAIGGPYSYGKCFAYVPPSISDALSEEQRKKLKSKIELGRPLQKNEKGKLVVDIDGDNRLAAEQREVTKSHDGKHSLFWFSNMGRHVGSGKTTIHKAP